MEHYWRMIFYGFVFLFYNQIFCVTQEVLWRSNTGEKKETKEREKNQGKDEKHKCISETHSNFVFVLGKNLLRK